MKVGFRSQCIPTFRVLTEDQIMELHLATLRLLDTVGVRVQHQEGLQLLRDAGCRIRGDSTVLVPGWLVEQCVRSAPSGITIFNRSGEEAMRLEGRDIYFGLGTDLIETYDLTAGQLRPSVLQDVANAARVADACGNIDFVASFALPHDVPTNTMYIESFRAEVVNSEKPIFFTAAGREDLEAIIEVAAAVTGGSEALREKPFLIHYCEPTPPLVHSQGAVNKLLLCAERGVPVNYTPAALLGASAPVTLAGGIVQGNAEALSGLVLHQLKTRGAPIISGFVATPMDMRTSTPGYCAPEFRLTHSACADMYHYYGIPVWGTAGASEANVLDPQAGFEATASLLTAAMDGCNLIHDVGYMGQGLIGNPANIVMCDEIIGWVKRMMTGFDASGDSLALDVIGKVGPGGSYLAEDHTLQFFRRELWQPRLLNRDNPDVWRSKGGKTYADVVTRRALEILATHQPKPLPESVLSAIEAIVRKAEKDLAGKHFVA